MLCETIQNTTQKNDCILATWCLSVMGVAPGVSSIDVSVVLPALLYALTANSFHSPSLEQEAIGAMSKLLQLRADDMAAQMLTWAPLVYVRLLSPTARVRDKAEAILAAHTSMLCSPASQLPKKVFDDLRSGLLTEMTEQLAASGKETIVMRAWGWLAQLAGPMLWHKSLVNSMLRVPEQTFAATRPEIRLETHVAWRRFVLNFRAQLVNASPPPGLAKRLALLLVPITACFRGEGEEQVRQACLQTWLQLVAAITVLPANAQSEFATELLETPLELLLKDAAAEPSSVLRIAASEVLEVAAGPAAAATTTAPAALNPPADDAPSRAEAIEVREIRHLTSLPHAAVLRLLRVALEQPHPVYDRLERVWRRLLAACGPAAEAHDPTPLVPLVKFAASAAEPSESSDAKRDWLGRSLYVPLLDRLQALHLVHVSPSPPLPDDRTLLGHLLYSWLMAPAATLAARAKQLEHLEPLLVAGHGLDAVRDLFRQGDNARMQHAHAAQP